MCSFNFPCERNRNFVSYSEAMNWAAIDWFNQDGSPVHWLNIFGWDYEDDGFERQIP